MKNEFNSFDEAVEYLFGLTTTGIKLGLDTISALSASFSNPQAKFKSILVAGTNGKGSVCAMLSQIFFEAGYSAGLSTSPHLVDVRERIRINAEMISRDAFVSLLNEVKEKADILYRDGQIAQYPTYFEFITMIMFLWFERQKVDIAILEIGLGGRFDAVNIVNPILSVITDIDLDHRKWLGDTLSKIALEKAGIIKPGKPVVVSIRQANALNEIKRIAEERNSWLYDSLESIRIDSWYVKKEELSQSKKEIVGALRLRMEPKIESLNIKSKLGEYDDLIPSLPGEHQQRNTKAVINATEISRDLGFDLSNESVIRGLERTDWPGRLEWFDWNRCPLLFDGAHNPAGIRALVKYLKVNLQARNFDLVFAVKKKKNYINEIKNLFPLAQSIWLVDMGKKGFVEPEKIKTRAGVIANEIEIAQGVDQFIQMYSLSAGSEFLLCTGSLHLIGNMKTRIAVK